jgi:hypothetical protein
MAAGGAGGAIADGPAHAVSSVLVVCDVPAWWAPVYDSTNPQTGFRDKDDAAAAAAQLEKLSAAQPVTVGVYVTPLVGPGRCCPRLVIQRNERRFRVI